MPEDWQPGNKAVFAYKLGDRIFVLRVHEIPNGNIEVNMEEIGGDSSHERKNLTSFIKMIEKCD